jgi:hypothetical protein
MITIKNYTSENLTAKSGKIFNIYKSYSTEYSGLKSSVGSLVYTIRDENSNELGFRKSKKAIENFLEKN